MVVEIGVCNVRLAKAIKGGTPPNPAVNNNIAKMIIYYW
jgi:hypothetical protein